MLFRSLLEPLSPAEMQILKLLYNNLSNNQIGEILDIKLSTVKTHVTKVFQKLGIKRRNEIKEVVDRLHLL